MRRQSKLWETPYATCVREHRSTEIFRSLLFAGIVTFSLLTSGCNRPDISGNYLAKFNDGVFWIQLVRTPDNRLAGQAEAAVLSPLGTVERNSVSVSGAVNGKEVTISTTLFGLRFGTLSGIFEGHTLRLIGGGQSEPIILTRANLGDYQREVHIVERKSEEILKIKSVEEARARTARQEEVLITSISNCIARMRDFNAQAEAHLGRFPGAEKAYKSVTLTMADYLGRERRLVQNPNAGVARIQIVVAMTQESIKTEQLHNSAQSLASSMGAVGQGIAKQAVDLQQNCRNVPGELTPEQRNQRSDRCRDLVNAYEPFRQEYDALAAGLDRLEQVYKQERGEQERLLETAQRSQ